MSTFKHPAGRPSATVYRRRRLLVGLALVAVIVAIVLIVVKPGSSTAEQKHPAAQPATTTSPSKPAATLAKATPTPGAPCTAASVKVEAVTDATHYAADEKPKLSLRVTNTGQVACTLNAGTSQQVFTISSGSDVYWRSTDCQVDAGDAVVTLKPGKPISSATPIAWERVRSAPDTCNDDTRPKAPAGGASYNLSVSIGGLTSAAPKQFILD
jgi:hypothetical protein